MVSCWLSLNKELPANTDIKWHLYHSGTIAEGVCIGLAIT